MREHLYPLFHSFFPSEAEHGAPAASAHAGHPAALGELLGQLLDHLKLLEQTVDIHHFQSAAGGDALLAAGAQDLARQRTSPVWGL